MFARDIAGKRYGSLVAIKATPIRVRRNVVWQFRCDCGTTIERQHSHIVRGNTTSCGCVRRKLSGARRIKSNLARTKHGHMRRNRGVNSPTLGSWMSMTQRCTKASLKSFKNYGGRGITICKRWHSFKNFLADMGLRPVGTTLERKRNDGNYEPGNCCWATYVEQGNNRRTNRPITFRGRTQNLKQWAIEIGVSHQAIAYRLKHDWSVEDAFITPLNHGNGWARGVR